VYVSTFSDHIWSDHYPEHGGKYSKYSKYSLDLILQNHQYYMHINSNYHLMFYINKMAPKVDSDYVLSGRDSDL